MWTTEVARSSLSQGNHFVKNDPYHQSNERNCFSIGNDSLILERTKIVSVKKILFPTDFSEAAENAFVYALNLAKAVDAQIVTLHVYQLPGLRSANLSNTLADYYEDLNLEEFENYRDKIPQLQFIAEREKLTEVEVYHCLEEGDTVPAILRAIESEEADMVVLGTTGATGAKEIFLGSVAGEVLENAPCPVLAVPNQAIFDGMLDEFAITTAYTDEDEAALRWLMDWADLFSASIEVIHADYQHAEDLGARMEKYQAKFADQEHLSFTVIDCNTFEEGISDYLSSSSADLLAMLTHKRNFWQELFSMSQIKKLSYHLDLPMLSLPSKML